MDKHLKEKHNPARKAEIRDGWLKDHLVTYVQFFPQVSSLLEVNIDNCTYGQGLFKNKTYSEMWVSYHDFKGFIANPQTVTGLGDVEQAHKCYNEVRRWLCKRSDDITSKCMKRFQLYIQKRDKSVSKF